MCLLVAEEIKEWVFPSLFLLSMLEQLTIDFFLPRGTGKHKKHNECLWQCAVTSEPHKSNQVSLEPLRSILPKRQSPAVKINTKLQQGIATAISALWVKCTGSCKIVLQPQVCTHLQLCCWTLK